MNEENQNKPQKENARPLNPYYNDYQERRQQQTQPISPVATNRWQQVKNSQYLKGVLVGAAGAYLLTNEKVQKAAIKTVTGLFAKMKASMEEFKEKVEDVKAEIDAENKEN